MKIYLSETLGIQISFFVVVVRNESKCLTVSPFITEMERLKNFICLFFLS